MKLIDVLEHLRPNAKWVIVGDDYSGLEWLDETQSMPSLAECETASLFLAQQEKISAIEKIRHEEYLKTADQLFFKWQAGEGTKAEWLAERKRIQSENPYPKS